jgi:hypothetical protein
MLATGGVVAAVHAPVAQAAGGSMFNCQPGYIYSMQRNGNINQIDPNGGVTNVYNASSGTGDKNGLGIGAGGSVAYWYQRDNSAANVSYLVKYTSGSNPVQVKNSGQSGMNPQDASMIAGAVDPTTENYLIAKISNQKIYLWAWTGTSYSALGFARNSKLPNDSLNGDIAFDAAGNLYIVSSTGSYQQSAGTQKVNITLIKKDDIQNAIIANNPQRSITATNATKQKSITNSKGFNGIAFDSDGYVYVGDTTTLYKYDSSTWQLVKTVTTKMPADSTDLSSCSTPPTLEVNKNLPSGRVVSDDQYTLNIADPDNNILTSETTTGSESGVQPDTAGPAPVVAGNQYIVSETAGNDSTDLSNYTSSLACIDTANGNATIAVDSSGKLTIPKGAAKPPSVVCTFTNTPKPVGPGAVQWTKVDAANTNTKLGGSEWKITGPSGSSSSDIAVKDCTSGNCSGTNDVDPQAGQFKVQNLAPGKYTLTETKAPDGYALDSTPHDFTVTSGATASASTAPLTNKKLEQAVCRADSLNLYNQLSTPDGSTDHMGATANKIQRYDVTNGQRTDLVDLYSLGVTRETNGLGISGDGRYFYVIDFNITSNPHIYQYDAQTGGVKTFNAANNGPNDNYRVRRGGVNLLNGIYYYSTTRQDSQGNVTNVNNLYALNPQTGQSWYVGAVNTRGDAAGQSGDLAFDNQGNMYFVVGQNGYAYVYVYSGALPQEPNSDPINITPQYLNAVGGTGNGVGIAYGGGDLYISNTNGDFYRVDPSTGATLQPAMAGVGGNGNTVDLATCTSPNTLTVKKDYPNGRGNADDNVTLSAWRNGSTQVGQNVDTDGPAKGVQTNQLGPVPILVGDGNSYTVRENAKGGSNSLAAYDTSYSCTDQNDPTWPEVTGTIPSGDTQREFTLGTISAGGQKARAIVCTISNKPISGSVTWSKSGPDGTTLLSGSEWTLTGPGVPTNTIVKDCTSTPCGTQPYTDKDPASGAFKLDSLPFGSYILTESRAPAGFVKDTTPRPFMIDATHREIKLGVFKNPQQTPPTLPLTGGLSTDAFLIGGSALIVVSAGVWLALRRRSRAEA